MSFGQSMWAGARATIGFCISTFLFGILFGIAASAAGILSWLTMFMSATVFSASAQFVTLEFWQDPLPLTTICVSVILVSARNILLGMSVVHHLDGNSLRRRIVCLGLLTDPGVVQMLRLKQPMDKLGYITGSGLSLMGSWLISTWFGLALATWVSTSQLDSLSFAGPLVFATMMVLFAKGNGKRWPSWAISGLVAVMMVMAGMPDYVILPIAVLVGGLAGLMHLKIQND